MRTVTVVGHGSARAVPDSAVVNVAATHADASLAGALAGAESARASIVASARGLDAAVASQDLGVWPQHDEHGRRSGFRARHSLRITCAELAQAGSVVGALADEVGDRLEIDQVSLTVTDPGPALVQAREAAYADARARAEHLAGLAGLALGEVITVVEGGSTHGGAPRLAKLASADVAFEPGETSLDQALTVTWELILPAG